jgi:hypothetical protein
MVPWTQKRPLLNNPSKTPPGVLKLDYSILHLCFGTTTGLFRGLVMPYLETNELRSRVRSIQQARPIAYHYTYRFWDERALPLLVPASTQVAFGCFYQMIASCRRRCRYLTTNYVSRAASTACASTAPSNIYILPLLVGDARPSSALVPPGMYPLDQTTTSCVLRVQTSLLCSTHSFILCTTNVLHIDYLDVFFITLKYYTTSHVSTM